MAQEMHVVVQRNNSQNGTENDGDISQESFPPMHGVDIKEKPGKPARVHRKTLNDGTLKISVQRHF